MKVIYRIKQLLLMTGDFIAFCFGFWLSLSIRNWQIPNSEIITKHLNIFIIIFFLWLTMNYINGLYELHQLKYKEIKKKFIEAAIISLILSVLLLYVLPSKGINPKTILLLNIFLGYSLSYLWRKIFNNYINSKALISNVTFLGLTPEIEELIKTIQRHPETGYKTKALIDPMADANKNNFPFFDTYTNLDTIQNIVKEKNINLIVISPELKNKSEVNKELYEILLWDKIKIVDQANFYENITGRIPQSTFSESWFLESIKDKKLIHDKISLLFDYLMGIIIGLLFFILLPFVAILTKMSSKGPVFFKQQRTGKDNKTFTLYKFRSMYALESDGSAESNGVQVATKNDIRVTLIGKFLRKTHIDELPQFINLLKGDMSLIGPRPERPEIVKRLTDKMPYYALRHMVKPGLTCWAVINQGKPETIEGNLEKLQYDLYYIKNRSFLLDLSIILKTLNLLIRMIGH